MPDAQPDSTPRPERRPDSAGGQPAPADLLPCPIPRDATQRLVLLALRRMASQGLHDAGAAMMMLNGFGLHFRQPLVLLRAFLLELSRCSRRGIMVSPCCLAPMTADEARMIGVLATAAGNPRNAERHLRVVTGADQVRQPLSIAAAFSDALTNLGRPLVI